MGKAIAQASLQEDAGVVVIAAREKSEIEGLVEKAPSREGARDPGRRTRQHRWTWMKDVSPEFLTEPTRFWETGPDVWKMLVDTSVNGPFSWLGRSCPGCWRRAVEAS